MVLRQVYWDERYPSLYLGSEDQHYGSDRQMDIPSDLYFKWNAAWKVIEEVEEFVEKAERDKELAEIAKLKPDYSIPF